MNTLLQINTSARAAGHANRLAHEFVDAWRARHPADRIVVRDLTTAPVPHLTETTLNAFFTPPEQRDEALQAAARLSDELIAEIQGADVIVIGVPMYNFGIPSTLKAYFRVSAPSSSRRAEGSTAARRKTPRPATCATSSASSASPMSPSSMPRGWRWARSASPRPTRPRAGRFTP